MPDADVHPARIESREFPRNLVFDPDEDNRKVELSCRRNRSIDGHGDSAISTHRVKGDGHSTPVGQPKGRAFHPASPSGNGDGSPMSLPA
jgi:hypothetical protein